MARSPERIRLGQGRPAFVRRTALAPDREPRLDPRNRHRLSAPGSRDPSRSFAVNARPRRAVRLSLRPRRFERVVPAQMDHRFRGLDPWRRRRRSSSAFICALRSLAPGARRRRRCSWPIPSTVRWVRRPRSSAVCSATFRTAGCGGSLSASSPDGWNRVSRRHTFWAPRRSIMSQFLLLPGPGFKVSEFVRQARAALD